MSIEISGYVQLRMETDVIVQIVHKPDLIIQHHLMGNMERLLCSFGVVHVYILNFVRHHGAPFRRRFDGKGVVLSRISSPLIRQ
jgi:hypothetical protein